MTTPVVVTVIAIPVKARAIASCVPTDAPATFIAALPRTPPTIAPAALEDPPAAAVAPIAAECDTVWDADTAICCVTACEPLDKYRENRSEVSRKTFGVRDAIVGSFILLKTNM